jgi:hypothetical protein
MARDLPKPVENDSPAAAPLIALVRLLARQAARDWAEGRAEANFPQTSPARPESQR